MIFSPMEWGQTLDQSFASLAANSYVNDLNAEKAGIIAAGITLGVSIDDIDAFYSKVYEKLYTSSHSSEAMYTCYIEAAYEVRTKGE